MLLKKIIKLLLKKIIVQGNNVGIQKLFDDIVDVSINEFTEDNMPTLSGFLIERIYEAFEKIDKDTALFSTRAMISTIENIKKNRAVA